MGLFEEKNKIIILSTTDNGGAGAASFNLMKICNELGHKTILVVKNKTINDENVVQVGRPTRKFITKIKNHLDLQTKIRRRRKREIINSLNQDYYFFGVDESIDDFSTQSVFEAFPFMPNIILSGWTSGFVNFKQLAELKHLTNAKVYAVMLDMAPLTGGCHYAWNCIGYQSNCNSCPALSNSKYISQAKDNLLIKLKNVSEANIKCIVASDWSKVQASKSTLFKNQTHFPVLTGYIDDQVFNSNLRSIAKEIFGVDPKKKTILIGAIDLVERRKGYQLFLDALKELSSVVPDREDIIVLIVGSETSIEIPFKNVFIPFIKDERLLSLLYQASDVYANTTIEDTGPQMLLQAKACGAVVVSFKVGFGYDVIDGVNGFHCDTGNVKALAEALFKGLYSEQSLLDEIRVNAKSYVQKNCSMEAISSFVNSL